MVIGLLNFIFFVLPELSDIKNFHGNNHFEGASSVISTEQKA